MEAARTPSSFEAAYGVMPVMVMTPVRKKKTRKKKNPGLCQSPAVQDRLVVTLERHHPPGYFFRLLAANWCRSWPP